MTKLEIVNNALMKAGLPLAASLDDCDWNVQAIFEGVAGEVLRCHPWNFAQRLKTLQQDRLMPPFGYKYSYALPEDCVKVVDVRPYQDLRSPAARFMVMDGSLLTNARPCNLRYVSRETPLAAWPPDFCDALSTLLASRVAALSAEKAQMAAQLLQLYQLSLSLAIAADARERRETMPDVNEFLEARRQGRGG